MIFAAINLDKDRPGDRAYVRLMRRAVLRRLRRRTYRRRAGVIGVVEDRHGNAANYLTSVGHVTLTNPRRVTIPVDAVHNGLALADLNLDGIPTTVIVGHAPHRRTTGTATHNAYWTLTADLVTRPLEAKGRAWVWLGDPNNNPQAIAAQLGGTAYGAEGDVMCVIASPLLRITHGRTAHRGRRQGWTGHAEAIANVIPRHRTPR